MEVFLLCNDRCLYTEVHESLWDWPSGYVLCGIHQSLETLRTSAIYPIGCLRGKCYKEVKCRSAVHTCAILEENQLYKEGYVFIICYSHLQFLSLQKHCGSLLEFILETNYPKLKLY